MTPPSVTECAESPNGKHDPYPTAGQSWSTCMTRGNTGGNSVRCSWCGIHGVERWREEERRAKGRGPFALETVRVVDGTTWEAP